MALPNVSIQIQNGGLPGVIPTDDALMGMILQGPAPSGLQLLTPKLISTLEEAEAVGITSAYDTDNTVDAWRNIKQFYDEAGNGAQIWIMFIAQAVDLETMMDKTEADYAVKLLDAAGGKIRVLGAVRNPAGGYTPDVTANHIDIDVVAALTTAQALAEEYAAAYKPLRVVLPAYAYDGNNGSLVDLKTQDKNRVAVLLGDTESGAGAAVGLLLGRLAAIPVQRNVGRVKSGSLPITEVYFGSSAFASVSSTVASIHDKGFITFRQYVGKAGYYFTDDPTATAATDDYRTLSNGRVIDKAIVIAYATFVNEILDEVLIDPNTGRIERAKAKYYQAIIENAVNVAMTAEGEISGFRAIVDPAQDVLTTGQICVEARIVPVGYAKEIIVKLGFENPATA